MRILYYTLGFHPRINTNELADYQSDELFHGLRSLFGKAVIDFPKKDYMYPGFPNYGGLWGRGYSYSNTLEDIDIDRDPDRIAEKISNNFYDLIVLSVHHSIHRNPFQLYNTLEWLDQMGCKSKIAVTDGNDERFSYNIF